MTGGQIFADYGPVGGFDEMFGAPDRAEVRNDYLAVQRVFGQMTPDDSRIDPPSSGL